MRALGAWMHVGDQRFDGDDIQRLYESDDYPLQRRPVDVLVSQGQAMADAIRQIGVSEVTYYRWRQEFGGLKTEQVSNCDFMAGKSLIDLAASRLALRAPALRAARQPAMPVIGYLSARSPEDTAHLVSTRPG